MMQFTFAEVGASERRLWRLCLVCIGEEWGGSEMYTIVLVWSLGKGALSSREGRAESVCFRSSVWRKDRRL